MSRAFAIALVLSAALGWHASTWAQLEEGAPRGRRPSPGSKAAAEANPPPMPQQLYKYKTKDGRTAYTNILDEVPPEQRAGHEVDLRHVALNTELGNELNQRAEQERVHKQLAATPYCENLKKDATKGELEQLWDDHPVPITCAVLIALLIVMTPAMMRSVHPPEWARVLSKVIPALFLVGGAMYGMQMANKKVAETRKLLKPCLNETFASLDESQDPAAERLTLIEQLKRDIDRAQARAGERDDMLEDLARER